MGENRFDHTKKWFRTGFATSFSFLLPSFFREKRKGVRKIKF